MSSDTSATDSTTTGHSATVERGRLIFFAKAIGETDPVYTDPELARQAGHRELPVPATFLFCLDMGKPDPLKFYSDMGINPRMVLHGEQEFTYHAMAYAGDTLNFSTELIDSYEKKDGALRFFVRATEVTRDGEPIAQLRNTIVVRDPRAV